MNSARANLRGIHVATFGCSGMQRRIGCLAAIAFHWLGSGSEGQARLLGHSAGLIEILVAQDEGAHRVLGK
jgi:hypothetical protein